MISRLAVLSFILAVLTGNFSPAQKRSIAVGVPSFPQSMNLLESTHIAARTIRANAARPAFERSGNILHPAVAGSLEVDAHLSRWTIDFSGARFTNGHAVNSRDAEFSFARCIKAVGADDIHVTPVEPAKVVLEATSRNKIEILNDLLTECPLIEAEPSEIFGEALGQGTNLPTSGSYLIASFDPGKKVSLVAGKAALLERDAATDIKVSAYADSARALSSLRSGGIDIYILASEDPVSLPSSETLQEGRCGKERVFYRAGLSFRCGNHLDFGSIHYD